MDEIESEEPSSSGQEDSNVQNDILNWAKVCLLYLKTFSDTEDFLHFQ